MMHKITILQVHVLHSEQSAVVVISSNLNYFIETPTADLNCFITYEVGSAEKQSSLQLEVGKVRVKASEIFCDKLWVTFSPKTGIQQCRANLD